VEALNIMRALEPEVVDAVWQAVEALLPSPPIDAHPLGCHRSRVADRVCFEGILIRLVTGCAWVDAERLLGRAVSDTTLCGRRDQWLAAECSTPWQLKRWRPMTGSSASTSASVPSMAAQHEAPTGGAGTGPSPVDWGKRGWRWSLFADRNGIPLGWATDGANRHDTVLLAPTLATVTDRGLLAECETLHLDRGYDNGVVRRLVADAGIEDLICSKVRPAGTATAKKLVPLGMRWPIERTNSWLSNYGQLRRNTDRRVAHRLAQLALAIALLLTAKLIEWRNRWSPT
jgi:transposase